MTIECSRCGGNHMRSECNVGIKIVASSVFEIEIWNKAIEAAALIADDDAAYTAVEIRRLKK